ncbi:MAG: NfeD family protein [Comamonadaceae bacterium]|nr:NfeD family protein [Comamonadaceae bacterium]
MTDANLWWLAAGAAVALELLSGTFYLLMLALGLAAGALAAHAGLGPTAQIVLAALVGSSAVCLAYLRRRPRPGSPSARADRSVNLDIGETLHIDAWQPDGTAQVKYRGAQWTALPRPGSSPSPGPHRVVELLGNRLVVEKI